MNAVFPRLPKLDCGLSAFVFLPWVSIAEHFILHPSFWHWCTQRYGPLIPSRSSFVCAPFYCLSNLRPSTHLLWLSALFPAWEAPQVLVSSLAPRLRRIMSPPVSSLILQREGEVSPGTSFLHCLAQHPSLM